MTQTKQQKRGRHWRLLGGSLGCIGLLWIGYLIDLDQLLTTLENANLLYLLLLFVSIATEQLVRAWKWRQLLFGLRPISTLRLFGAIMAGYFANYLVPLGVSPLVRSWLIARLDKLAMSTVLATVVVDRIIDGFIFLGFVAVVVVFAVFPDPKGDLRLGLVIGGVGSLVLLPLLLLMLIRHQQNMAEDTGLLLGLVKRLPASAVERTRKFLHTFCDGILWPEALWRRLAILVASVVIKLIAVTHLLWAGLAFGVLLNGIDYLFLLVFLGFLIILSRFARIPGGFIVGGTFALGLLGVKEELAVAMVGTVSLATAISVALFGTITLWRHGISLAELESRNEKPDESA